MRLNIPCCYVEMCEVAVKMMIQECAPGFEYEKSFIRITKSRPGYNLICYIGDTVIAVNKIARKDIRKVLIDPYSIFIKKIIKTLTGKELN